MTIHRSLTAHDPRTANSKLVKDLKRHVCSLTVLAYGYQRHLPHLLSPGLSKLTDSYLSYGQQITEDIALFTRRICELNGSPVSRVEEIESSSYLPLTFGGRFVLNDELRKQLKAEERLGMVLGHTIRLAQKNGDSATFEVASIVLAKSKERGVSLTRMLG